MATVDEIRAKYTCDDVGNVQQLEAKWNALCKKAKSTLVPWPQNPKIKHLEPSVRQELQKFYEQTKASVDAINKLVRKMENTTIDYGRGYSLRAVV